MSSLFRLISLSLAFTLIHFLFTNGLAAQPAPPNLDSLETELENATDPTQKSLLYEQLVQANRRFNADAAMEYGRKMRSIEASKVPSSPRLSDAYDLLANMYYQYGYPDSSVYYAQLNVELLKNNPQFPGQARRLLDATTRLGIASPSLQQITVLNEALTLDSITARDSAIIYNTLGNAYYNDTRYDESLVCFDYTIAYARKSGNKRLEAMGLNNASEPLSTQGRFKLAEEYIIKATQLAEELGEKEGIVHCTRSLAYLYNDMGDRQRATETMREAIVKSRALNNPFLTGLTLSSRLFLQDSTIAPDPELIGWAKELGQIDEGLHASLAHYYSAIQDHSLAAYHAEEGIKGMRATQQDSSYEFANTLIMLATAQEKAGNYRKAAKNYREVTKLRKAQETKRQEESFAETAVKMEMAENELARQRAEAETKLGRQASAAQTRLFGLGALAAALILGIIVWAYLRSRRDAQRISAQKALVDQSLSEKDVLLREIHHRVKNNLQIISTLLQKQARQSDSEDLKEMIRDGQERIQSMALIHENLYRSEQLSGVSIKQYLRDLTDSVSKSQGTNKVAVDLKVKDEHLDLDTAIPLGLILNELITNAYKYAFPDNRRGAITVEFEKQNDGQHILTVSDDGVGLPSDHEVRQRNSLGLNLVKGLVGQLEGSIDWVKGSQGTSVAIQF